MIRARGLGKRFGARVAVADASFEVAAGQIVGFLGENGAGKTTTLRMLAGFVEPSSGSAELAGIDVSREPERARQQLGYLPETVPLYDELRVVEHLGFRARLKGHGAAAVELAIRRAGLDAVRRQLCGQLSRGLRQRVGVADAILGEPPVVLLDEPTTGLDPNQLRDLRELLRQLSPGRAILLSTHALAEAEKLCDRLLVMHRGRIVADATPAVLAESGGPAGLDGAFAALTSAASGHPAGASGPAGPGHPAGPGGAP